jgi:alpha-L-rhamnosidase
MFKKSILAVFFYCCLVVLHAQHPVKNIKTDWQASWICPPSPNDTLKNMWLCWRKTFDIDANIPPSVFADIAVDSKYWLYINGQMVVFEGQLKRGPTLNDTYFDRVDIGKYLKKGKNTIAILQWYFGKQGFSHNSSGRAGLLFEAQLSSKFLASSKEWKVIKHPAYLRNSAHPNPNFRLSEHNIFFDAQQDIGDWFSTNYDDTKWANAIEIGKAPCQPWGALWQRTIPFWYNSGLQRYTHVTVRQGAKQDTFVATLPRNLTVTPYMRAIANGSEKIEIRTDNYYGGSAPNVRTDYICKKGRQEFETFGFMNGHEVWYIVPKSVDLIDVQYRETRYDFQHVGYMDSYPFLNKLWEKSRNTLDISMRDNYMDCPDRERAQWWGDAVLQVGETFYAYDRKADLLTQKAISNFLEWQKKDSVLFAPVPAGNWVNELPGQSLATVWGILDYYNHSGDTAMMLYAYPFVKKYMALWRMDSNDLVIHREGGWMWHDWGDKVDVPVLDNTWYYRALEAEEKMAFLTKNTEGVLIIKSKRDRLKKAFHKHFWRGGYFASPTFKHIADDRANGMAVVSGLSHNNQWQSIKAILDTTFNAGPYLEKYILEAYFMQNETQAGLERMEKRYKKMVESPLTTLWEGWEVGSATYGGGTYNHGWTGGPLTLMSQYIGGLSPNTEGYQTFKFLPQLADIQYFKMGAMTVKGFASIDWNKRKNNPIMTITTPQCDGIIGVPKSKTPIQKISVNGKIVWQDGKFVDNTEGVVFSEDKPNHIIFKVKKGVYVFDIVPEY